jgi:hypothetical protein
MVNDDCPSRAPFEQGDCYRVKYAPDDQSVGWAGVVWQFPANNWGTYKGHTIAPGGKHVTLWARGETGGEVLQFRVGGCTDDTQKNHDTITVPDPSAGTPPSYTLTTAWKQFGVDFDGGSQATILCAFGWVVQLAQQPNIPAGAQRPSQPLQFYLDAIEWTP